MVNLPDTYAGGTFDLPLKVAKIVRLAESTSSEERLVAMRKLWDLGYFLDRVGIVWEKSKVPEHAKDSIFEALDTKEK